jgi:hypothetical protein
MTKINKTNKIMEIWLKIYRKDHIKSQLAIIRKVLHRLIFLCTMIQIVKGNALTCIMSMNKLEKINSSFLLNN